MGSDKFFDIFYQKFEDSLAESLCRFIPLLNDILNESFLDHKLIVSREFPCMGSGRNKKTSLRQFHLEGKALTCEHD